MKKLIIFVIPLFIVLAYFQNSYAKSPYRSYEISEIRSGEIVITDSKGVSYIIENDPGNLKVGDLVRYDSRRHRLKKSPWQPAKIINMRDRILTLKVNSGKSIEVIMKSKYRGKFSEGDQVLYNGSSGKIKKSDFQKIDEE